ncbi:arginase family protein [Neomoorella mulderi]|uniref:Arginase family protein n=1 Tax=Moorella mulderi DSM 14980 TaxID=1122241 RepID=A0A151AUQ2_9FIRM|nr:arginase family protein [Moorella mulderi]KYH31404.1 arginase family protein [Moorella mulderi DSM 14980]
MGVSCSMAVTLLNFDDTLTMQEELHRFPHSQVDLRDLKGTRLFCDRAALRQIAGRIRDKKGIFFVGSGDYHYVSYLLMQTVDRPFTLVLFDNHADLKLSPAFALLSCSSWVAWALRLPNLKKAIIIGARPDSFIGVDPGLLRKVVYVPSICLRDFSSEFPPVTSRGMGDTYSRIIALIPTRSVYISVDKDVLRRQDAITNWEQGEMSLADLLLLLQAISRAREVCGVDICGEADLHPLDRLRPAGREAIRKNTQANVRIIQALLQTRTFKQVS